MVIDLYTDFGTALNRIPVEGLVSADFISSNSSSSGKIYDITDNSDLTITVVESSTIPGRYTLSYTGAVSSEELQVLGNKDGFDFTPMLNVQATVA